MIRINLLPVRAEKRKENVRKHGILLVCYVAFVVAVIFGIQMSQISAANAKRETIERQNADIVALDKTIKEVQNYKVKLAELTDKLNVVVGLEQRQRGPARYLGELANVIPEKVWIERLTENGGFIQIDGWTIDQQTLAQFMMNIEASKVFQKVTLKVTKRLPKAGIELQNFSIDVIVSAQPVPTALSEQMKGGQPSPAPAPVAPVAAQPAAPVPQAAAPQPDSKVKAPAPAAPQAQPAMPAPPPSVMPKQPVKPAPAQAPKPAKAG